jgi:hypothetical protein
MFQRCLLPPSSGLVALMMEEASTYETSVNFYQITSLHKELFNLNLSPGMKKGGDGGTCSKHG